MSCGQVPGTACEYPGTNDPSSPGRSGAPGSVREHPGTDCSQRLHGPGNSIPSSAVRCALRNTAQCTHWKHNRNRP